MERSAQTHADGFQLSATNVKIGENPLGWQTLYWKDVLGEAEAFKSEIYRAGLSLTFQSHHIKIVPYSMCWFIYCRVTEIIQTSVSWVTDCKLTVWFTFSTLFLINLLNIWISYLIHGLPLWEVLTFPQLMQEGNQSQLVLPVCWEA